LNLAVLCGFDSYNFAYSPLISVGLSGFLA
jgi:hypothetical protein